MAAQAFSDPPVGRRAARLLAEGASRDAVLAAVQVDPGAALRQLVGVTSSGMVLASSGALYVPVAADCFDDGAGFAVAGNMLADCRVVYSPCDHTELPKVIGQKSRTLTRRSSSDSLEPSRPNIG